MQYQHLIDGMKRVGAFLIRNIREISQTGAAIEVQGAQLMRTQGLELENRFYSPSLLFVGLVSELPSDPSHAPLHCICIEDIPLPSIYEQDSTKRNLILLEMPSDTEALMLVLNSVCFLLTDDFRFYQVVEFM